MDRISRRTVGWLVGAAAILVAVGIVLGVVLTDDAPERQQEARTQSGKICVANGQQLQVRVNFAPAESDDHMRRAAEALRDDDRITELTTQTQAEAYAEFKVIFEQQPEMGELARPDSLPASLLAVPSDDISHADLAAALEDELTGVQDVEVEACARLEPSR